MSKNSKAVIALNSDKKDNSSKIDAIKNLIFGEDIQAYDAEFETLKQDILDKKMVLEAMIDEIGSDLRTAIDNVSTDVHNRITELESNLDDKMEDLSASQVDKKTLSKLLIDLGEKIGKK